MARLAYVTNILNILNYCEDDGTTLLFNALGLMHYKVA